jgi:hypothetical protein
MEGRALGLRVKLGWALAIVVRADDDGQPTFVARDELRFAAADGVFGYHAAMDAEPEARWAIIAEAADRAADAATDLLAGAVEGHDVATVGLVVGRGVRRIPLDRILASSSLFHTAEAEVLQDAFAEAAARLDVPCVRVPFAATEADASWGVIGGLGKAAGTPWRKDHKFAATAAWVALRATAGAG